MPGSTYSSNLKIELMTTGENSGTWGDVTNSNLGTALEQAIIGYGNPDYTSDANLTITITNSNASQAARCLVLNVTSVFGALTATRELIVPTSQKQYIVQNNTTGGQSITVKTSAGTGITVPNGRKAHLYVDGTNVIQMFDFVDINGGAIDGTPIGASSASTGAFTTLSATGNVTLGDADTDTITQAASYVTGTQLKSAKTATNTLALAAYDVDGTAYTNLITLTASNTPTLALTSTGVGTINNMSIGATTPSTGAFAASSAISGVFNRTTSSGATLEIQLSGINIGTLGSDTGGNSVFDIAATNSMYLRATGTGSIMTFSANNAEYMRIASATGGVGAVGIGYTSLTSVGNNGLAVLGNVGIGTSNPTQKLTVDGVIASIGPASSLTASSVFIDYNTTSNLGRVAAVGNTTGTAAPIYFSQYSSNASVGRDAMIIDSIGNLGLGVTPSAWYTSFGTKAFQFAASGALYGLDVSSSDRRVGMSNNSFINTSGNNIYLNTGAATQYQQTAGQHQWFNAASGTAANAISFTQAMTLDANGNLLVATTSATASPSSYSLAGSQTHIYGSSSANSNSTAFSNQKTTLWIDNSSATTNNEYAKSALLISSYEGAGSNPGPMARFYRQVYPSAPARVFEVNNLGNIGLGDTNASTTGTGITFPATQSASSDANTLDDYEEGTWTPNQGVGLTVVGAFSSSGTYTKIGRQITITGTVAGATSVSISAGGTICTNCPLPAGSGNYAGSIFNAQTGLTGSQVWQQISTVYNVAAAAAATSHVFTVTYFV